METHRTCTICKLTKPIERFQKNKRSRNGRKNQCYDCAAVGISRWRKTKRGKAWLKAYFKSKRGKAARARGNKKWRDGPKGKAWFAQRHVKDWHNGKSRKYRKRHPLKSKARDRVKYAIRTGKLPRSRTLKCTECGKQAAQYHHHKGYAVKNHLDVVPVCRPCHLKLG